MGGRDVLNCNGLAGGRWLTIGVLWLTIGLIPSPVRAAGSLTEQLQRRPQSTLRLQRDVADQFLLMGRSQLSEGIYDQAITALTEAANAYHYLGDFVGMGEAYEQLVKAYSDLGQYRDAERVVRQQLAVARSNVNFNDQILALNNLGTLSLHNGELAQAHSAFTEGLTVAQDIDSNSGIGLSLSNLGLVAMVRGQHNDARQYYEVAADYRARARDYVGQANTSNNLGDAYLAMGQMGEAIGAYRLSRSFAQDLGDPYLQLRAIDGLIAIYRQREEPSVLSDYLAERIELAAATDDDWQRLLTLRTLGEIYADTGNLRAAYESFQQALQLAEGLGRKSVQVELANRVRSLSVQMID